MCMCIIKFTCKTTSQTSFENSLEYGHYVACDKFCNILSKGGTKDNMQNLNRLLYLMYKYTHMFLGGDLSYVLYI